MRYLRLYGMFIEKNLRAKMEFLTEFWINLFGRLFETALAFLFFWVTIHNVANVGGWTLWELGLILAITSLVRAIAELFFLNVWVLPLKIRKGDLDIYLTKPINPLFHLIAERVEVQGLGLFVSGIIILIWSISHLTLHVSFWGWVYFIIMVICGGALYLFLLLLFATIAFWFPGADTYIMAIAVSFNEFAKYPVTIFPKGLQILLTWILPFAFTGYVPALFLLGKTELSWIPFSLIPITALFGAISYLVWKRGLRHYGGTGT